MEKKKKKRVVVQRRGGGCAKKNHDGAKITGKKPERRMLNKGNKGRVVGSNLGKGDKRQELGGQGGVKGTDKVLHWPRRSREDPGKRVLKRWQSIKRLRTS